MKIFTNEFRHLRHRAGWTQEETASKLGVSQSWVAAMEGGRGLPSDDLLDRCDTEFGTDGTLRRTGPVLRFTLSEWRAFTEGAKDGEFDLF